MSTKTPSDDDDGRVSITNQLVNATKNTEIPLDSKEANTLATQVTDTYILPRNGGYSQKRFHIPDPGNEKVPVCDCQASRWEPQDPDDYPTGWHPLCTHCFAWLLATHYPDVLSGEDGDER